MVEEITLFFRLYYSFLKLLYIPVAEGYRHTYCNFSNYKEPICNL